MTWDKHYDVVIVGAGIAGSALAHALATLPRPSAPTALDPSSETSWQGSYNVEPPRPMRICVLERSLAPPDRIVGELLQPGGMRALGAIGMAACTEGIDAVPVRGYAVVRQKELVEIPYPEGAEGRSFHHGRFIGKLREAVMNVAEAGKGGGRDVLAQVDVIEATVQELVECDFTNRIIGVRAVLKTPSESATVPALPTDGPSVHPPPADTEKKETFFADLVVIADGCFSNFRSQVLGPSGNKPTTKSHFVGLVLEDVKLPIPHHGTVCLVKNSGPVLLYQIAEHDTRMLVDVKAPLPSDLKGHILMNIVPQLLPALQPAVRTALEKDRLRRMPNSFLPPTRQSKRALRQRPVKEGVVLIGDAWNMRHPLTGGGMTVAFNDVEILAKALVQLPPGELGFGDWERVRRVVEQWETDRRPLASTVNILSVALYDLFGAEDVNLNYLREGCFKYFQLGGDYVGGPVSLLSGIAPKPALLFRHFFQVAFYSIWVMFMHAQRVPSPSSASNGNANGHANGHTNGNGYPAEKSNGYANGHLLEDAEIWVKPGILEYPGLFLRAILVFWTACIVFGPLMWAELKWW